MKRKQAPQTPRRSSSRIKEKKDKETESTSVSLEEKKEKQQSIETYIPAISKGIVSNEEAERDAVFLFLKEKIRVAEAPRTLELHMKIWKCLFYYIWTSETPRALKELCQKVGGVAFDFFEKNEECGLLHLRAAFQTLSEEWPLIDSHRLDKFYELVRSVLSSVFELVERKKLDHKFVSKAFNVFSCFFEDVDSPSGIRIFCLQEIFGFAARNEEKAGKRCKEEMLRPVCILFSTTKRKAEREVLSELLLSLEGKKEKRKFLLGFGTKKETSKENRKAIYEVCQKLC